MEAKLYEVQENFEFRGVSRKKGDTFRITDEKADGLGDKVKLSDDQARMPTSSLESTPDSSDPTPENTPEPTAPQEGKQSEGSEPSSSLPQNMPETSKYKVKEAFELPGETPESAAVGYEVDAEVELTEEQATELGEKVEKVEATE